jgi:hypothetical protein
MTRAKTRAFPATMPPLQIQVSALQPVDALRVAEWLHDFDSWDRDDFVREIGEFIYSIHGSSCQFDRHLVSMLADQMQCYALCSRILQANNLIVTQNGGVTSGAHPAIGIRERAAIRITALMTELRVTPRTRADVVKQPNETWLKEFLAGPFGANGAKV